MLKFLSRSSGLTRGSIVGDLIKGGTLSRNVLVTGTSYGLGAAVSEAVRSRGDQVFSLSRTPPASRDEVWVPVDFEAVDTIADAVKRLADRMSEPLGGVVLNAALADKTRSQWTGEQVERHFRVNALAPFVLWGCLEEGDLVDDPCNVVLMGSFLQNGNVRQPAYAMSKAALWSWMRSYTMQQDTAARVSMNMIWPGRVVTPANPLRELPDGDPNLFYAPDRVADVVLTYLYQPPHGPRGTVVDLGRS
jgi:NAD(P)-dependent dehydrogenase (short-subunit alcohol dehydrogenase family)